MGEVFVIDAVRTPIGKIGGALAGVRPDDLASGVIAGLVERNGWLDPASIDDVQFGNGNGAGEENRNVARMASLLAGLPVSVPGATTNRLCGSGMEAVLNASREVQVGDATVVIAGGVESMTRAPWVVQKPDQPYERGHQQMHSTTLGWRMVNPRHAEGLDHLARRLHRAAGGDMYGITREAQDAFAVGQPCCKRRRGLGRPGCSTPRWSRGSRRSTSRPGRVRSVTDSTVERAWPG